MKPSFQKYIPFKQIDIPDRTWPNNVIDRAPVWCSVDLRDGNQALVDPMTLKEKLEFFHALVDMGFKEIEIGFPSASETEYEICRELIENNHIPDDVTIQVLVQAREHLIRKTFEAIKGAKNVIVHFYNSTSTLQRKVVFKTDMQGVIDIAVEGAKLIKKLTDEYTGDTNIRFEYSPESFSGTEPDNAVAICDRVMEELGSTKENPVILNLPNTVEMCTPNTYADQIEYFIRHLKNREAAIISVHPHNDRGCGVAAGELALLAGAERVEGTLFGNGERTGNMDIVTMGLNMFTQGVDPKLDFSNLPKRMHPEFSKLVQAKCEALERELIPKELFEVFEQNYLEHPMKYTLTRRKIYEESEYGKDYVHFKGRMKIDDGSEIKLQGTGNGPIDAFFNALKSVGIDKYEFISYSQHAISQGSDSKAVSYIELRKPDGRNIFGIGIDANVNVASVLGVLNAINRAEANE